MKRSKTWLLASVLSIVVVFCIGLTGITLAKYVVGRMSIEKARVAKWGVVITVSDESAFKTEYESEDEAGTLSVKSSSTDRLVAPGTSDSRGMTFAIKGKPEVATKIDVFMSVKSDVFVDDYYPIVFTLKQTVSASGAPMETVSGNLSEIEEAFEGWAANAYFEPNTDLTNEFNLSWEWKYENGSDEKDEILGSLAAGTSIEAYPLTNKGETWSVDVDYDITITVTQAN